jgi:ataxin-3
MQYYGITLPHIHTTRHQDAATMQGFICHRHDHWFCIRNIAGRFWDLNSTRALAEPISHFKIATSMDAWTKEGYTIFAVQGGLPSVGQKPGGETKAASDGNWHLMSDLLKGNATAKDPFTDLVGRGMRLDGGGGAANSENEMDDLQRALQASLRESVPLPPVPPEPPANAAGSVRLQLKLPNGERLVRRFLESDSVLAVYAVVKDMSPNAGALNLRVGFPPRDMSHLQGLTIGQAGLKGESIQGRYV